MVKTLEYVEYKQEPYYRPYCTPRGYLDNIVLYDDDGFIFETMEGWLTSQLGDVRSITIQKPKLKRELDFKCKKNFLLYDRKAEWAERRPHLYLYVDGKDISIKSIGSNNTTLEYFQRTYIRTFNKYLLNIKGDEFIVEYKVNEICKENTENINRLKIAKDVFFQKGIKCYFNDTQIELLLEKGLLNV